MFPLKVVTNCSNIIISKICFFDFSSGLIHLVKFALMPCTRVHGCNPGFNFSSLNLFQYTSSVRFNVLKITVLTISYWAASVGLKVSITSCNKLVRQGKRINVHCSFGQLAATATLSNVCKPRDRHLRSFFVYV